MKSIKIVITAAILCALGPSSAASSGGAVIMVLGDSLSAAYGIDMSDSWVELLRARLRDAGFDYEVVNESISGETTRGGLDRLPKALKNHRPQVVLVELGANDGLRGLPLAETEQNLLAIVRAASKRAKVVLLGMRLPPNYGPAYTERFFKIYERIASSEQAVLVPFFLEGVGDNLELLQNDGLHPTDKAQPMLLENVWPHLNPLL